MLRDIDIRQSLIEHLTTRFKSEYKLVEELSISDKRARADVVVLAKSLFNYEIKSDVDSLSRFTTQMFFYDRVFERNFIVTTDKHLAKAIELLPSHWGLLSASPNRQGSVKIKTIKAAKMSPHWEPATALFTLWKSELIDIYEELKLTGPTKSLSREQLIEEISTSSKRGLKQSFKKALTTRDFTSSLRK
ncbi:CII phage-related protein [Idiomarina loihiensis L2TR]|uniref:CII phage-related protein n=2 Tax=Idiomarina loihiensis TaxID=135577 RepID=Q5QVJ8_IDILO|nr:CII phage-related protein [Idiomarina loihiensis L2TR]